MAVTGKLSRQEADKVLVAILKDENSTSRQLEGAFNQLYATHQRQITYYFYKSIRNTEDAEDLKMQTFEKVHANISSYDDKFAFSTWMYAIALNCLIDHKRKENFKKFSTESLHSSDENGVEYEFQIKSNSLDPEETISRDERIERVKGAIASLDSDFIRELMVERYVNELSFDEIAKKLGIDSSSTLRVNILRGKEILKKNLDSVNPFK